VQIIGYEVKKVCGLIGDLRSIDLDRWVRSQRARKAEVHWAIAAPLRCRDVNPQGTTTVTLTL
jgi:hypothetical protein